MADEVSAWRHPFPSLSVSVLTHEQGASPQEQIIEACRRDNTSILHEIFSTFEESTGSSEASKAIASLINTTQSPTGFYPLHIAAQYGSYDVLDALLDQVGVETEPRSRLDQRTPLHYAVEFCNGLDKEKWEQGQIGWAVVDILLDAGCDPRTRDKNKVKAVDVCDPTNESVRGLLRRAEMALQEGDALVHEDAEDDEGGSGSASDSD